MIILSSCRNDDAPTIRNVRFAPGLLNPIQAANGAPCVSYSYYYNDEAKALGTVYSRMILVAFDESLSHEQVVALAGDYSFVESLGQPVQTNSARLYPAKLIEGLNCKQVEAAIAQLGKNKAVTYAAPYFLSDGGTRLLGVSNEFIVTVGDKKALERLARTTRTAVVTSLGEGTYILRTDKNSRGNALEMANFFQQQPQIKHAEPDFVVSLEL